MTIPEIVGLAIGCLIIACGIIIAVFFLCGYLTFKDLCHRKESLDKLEQSPYVGALGPRLSDFCEFREDAYNALKGTPFSWESVTSVDDARLFGRFYKVDGANKTIICVPGYLTSGVQCFAYILPFYMANGYNVSALELTDPENTPKNTLIKAIKNEKMTESARQKAKDEYESTLRFLLGEGACDYLSEIN